MRTRRKARQVAAARIDQLIAVDCLGEIDDRADAQLHRQVLLQDLALLGKIMPTVTEEALRWHCRSAASLPATTIPGAPLSRSTRSRRRSLLPVRGPAPASCGRPRIFRS